MAEPWFWVHIKPYNRGTQLDPLPSRYPVVGFHKEPDLAVPMGGEQRAGEVVLLIDDGVTVHALRQVQALRCPDDWLGSVAPPLFMRCPVCQKSSGVAPCATDTAVPVRITTQNSPSVK